MTPGPPRRRRPPLPALALAAVAALVLSACGSGGDATAGDTDSTPPKETKQPAVAPHQPCPAEVGAFVDSLDRLRRALAVGLSYEQYAAKIGALQASYDRLPVDRLGIGCLTTAGTPAEKSFDGYIDAANSWGECLADASCSTATIESVLQRKWRAASRLLSEAA